MMKKAIFCLVSNEGHAQRLVDRLMSYGCSNEDVSLLCPDKSRFANGTSVRRSRVGEIGIEKATKAPEGGATGALAGGILGGSLGLLAGIGALAIPGLGPFIAAGPLLAALSGSALGGSLGLLIGTLVGLGIPEYEAKKFEAGLKAGNILVCVHCEDENKLEEICDIMKQENATDISTSREKARMK